MESSSLSRTLKPLTFTSSSNSIPTKQLSALPISKTKLNECQTHFLTTLYATLNSPKPSPKKAEKMKSKSANESDNEGEEGDDEQEEGIIPEMVTNRMISRIGFTVGIPLLIGLLFFPFFYYLKVGLKIDVPTWVPFIVSFIFFGSALLGVSYGIVSSSWDPLREGSLLGWNEAQKNWPVFWQSLWGGSSKK
ncbi:protein PAM68, chloroplastic-like [Mangifera indica]|uniref:protein PAM68, chloroplastic-like n=1 Tax=Mangifera indica TaxID=29780 RepID=UPI001CFAAE11|nr:protein PAM68, chloroplastic-like [Mangifera indica]